MSFLRNILIFVSISFSNNFAVAQLATATDSQILEFVDQNLAHSGVLKNSNGFIYIDVDDDYIHKLITFIQDEGYQEPPYFEKLDLVGAHISVIYRDEFNQYGLEQIQECGKTFYFIPKRCQSVHPERWAEMDEVFFIVVESPELALLREKYGLPKREYEFHITIGVKPKIAA